MSSASDPDACPRAATVVSARNPAPAHLEAKLRFWEFTVGQIAAVFAGVLIGVVWAKFLCPFDGMWAAERDVPGRAARRAGLRGEPDRV